MHPLGGPYQGPRTQELGPTTTEATGACSIPWTSQWSGPDGTARCDLAVVARHSETYSWSTVQSGGKRRVVEGEMFCVHTGFGCAAPLK